MDHFYDDGEGLLDAAWRDPVVKVVVAFTDSDNEPSQGVLRRAGFQQVDLNTDQLWWEVEREPVHP